MAFRGCRIPPRPSGRRPRAAVRPPDDRPRRAWQGFRDRYSPRTRQVLVGTECIPGAAGPASGKPVFGASVISGRVQAGLDPQDVVLAGSGSDGPGHTRCHRASSRARRRSVRPIPTRRRDSCTTGFHDARRRRSRQRDRSGRCSRLLRRSSARAPRTPAAASRGDRHGQDAAACGARPDIGKPASGTDVGHHAAIATAYAWRHADNGADRLDAASVHADPGGAAHHRHRHGGGHDASVSTAHARWLTDDGANGIDTPIAPAHAWRCADDRRAHRSTQLLPRLTLGGRQTTSRPGRTGFTHRPLRMTRGGAQTRGSFFGSTSGRITGRRSGLISIGWAEADVKRDDTMTANAARSSITCNCGECRSDGAGGPAAKSRVMTRSSAVGGVTPPRQREVQA